MPSHFMFQFQTKRGTWMEEAVCRAKHFNRLEDGSYVGDAGGSPIWFRCVERHDDHFVHVDGGGRRFRYRLLPVEEDGTIKLPEGGVLYPNWWPNRPEVWGAE